MMSGHDVGPAGGAASGADHRDQAGCPVLVLHRGGQPGGGSGHGRQPSAAESAGAEAELAESYRWVMARQGGLTPFPHWDRRLSAPWFM